MRPLIPALLLLAAVGCEGSNELVAPERPTPTPTFTPTPTPTPSYVIGGTVTRNGRPSRATVTATSGGRQWTTASSSGSGHYQIIDLPAGEFQVSASASYCYIQTKLVTVPPNATVDFRFVACWRDPTDNPEK